MQKLPVTALHPDGQTIVRLDYREWPADHDSGIPFKTIEILEVRLETGEDITDDLAGNQEWYEHINRFLTDPWFYEPDGDYTEHMVGLEPTNKTKEYA